MSTFNRLWCPVCDDAGQGFTVLDPSAEFGASRCTGCGLGIEHRLSADPVGPYARPAYDAVRNGGAGGPRWRRYHHDTAVAALRLAQLGTAVPRGGSWVDVGCSNGAFLALAARRGWRVLGVEADPAAADEVSRAVGLPVVDFRTWAAAARSGTPQSRVDVVSFFDVVEHVLDPVGALAAAAGSLAPGGALVIEAPDLDAVDPVDFPGWVHRRVRADFTEHVWHFSERALETLRVRHLPGLHRVRCARPVSGRIQVVWRSDASPPPPAAPADPGPRGLALGLLRRPEAERRQILAGMQAHDPDTYRQVAEALAELHAVAATSV